MQSKKKQTFEVDTEETAVTGINDKKSLWFRCEVNSCMISRLNSFTPFDGNSFSS
jgi:hypothetical protein